MRIPTLIKHSALFLLTVVAISVLRTDTSFAATKTWTGGGSDDNFTTSANWSPSGAPTAGDDIVINNSGSTTLTVTDDLSGVSLGSITLAGSASVYIGIENTQVITGDITSTTGGSSASVIARNVQLGADVTSTNVNYYASANYDTLDLNGHVFTYMTNSSYSGGDTTGISQKIIGNGMLTIQVDPSVSVFLDGVNTYSGITNLISAGNVTNLSHDSSVMFGTSTINISAGATLSLDVTSTLNFANPINIAAAVPGSNGFLEAQLYIWNTSNPSANVTATIPNITLSGNARFAVNTTGGGVTVNLAGIAANGHCIQYGDADNSQAGNFQNGPAACVIGDDDNATAPGAPDTGFGQYLTANPVVPFAAAVGSVFALFLFRRSVVRARSN